MPQAVLLVFFAAAVVFTPAYAAGLIYHWVRFGWLYPWVWIALPLYGVGVFIFMSIMVGTIAIS